MAIQNINIGVTPNDRSGDSLRQAFNKSNQNFEEIDNTLKEVSNRALHIDGYVLSLGQQSVDLPIDDYTPADPLLWSNIVTDSTIPSGVREALESLLIYANEDAATDFSGSYVDLTDVPAFSTVAYTGNFNDIIGHPELFSGDYNDLTNLPVLFSGDYNDLVNRPAHSVVSATGDYNDLLNLPTIPSIVGLASETYVDNSIAALVDTSPATLDTLNELAAALGDDPNFATTITNSIALKANTADLATVATSGSYNDLVNLPTLFSGDYNDLTSLPVLFSGDYNDLVNRPILFSGDYNDLTNTPTLATVATTGSYDDLTDVPVKNIIVIDGVTTPYLGTNTTYATRLQIPIDVDEVHLYMGPLEVSALYFEILAGRTKDLSVYTLGGTNRRNNYWLYETDDWEQENLLDAEFEVENWRPYVALDSLGWFTFKSITVAYGTALLFSTNQQGWDEEATSRLSTPNLLFEDGFIPSRAHGEKFFGRLVDTLIFDGQRINEIRNFPTRNDVTTTMISLLPESDSVYFYNCSNALFYSNYTVQLDGTPATNELLYYMTPSQGAVVTIHGNGYNIEGSATYNILSRYQVYKFQFDGTEWKVTPIPYRTFMLGDYIENEVAYKQLGVRSKITSETGTISVEYKDTTANDLSDISAAAGTFYIAEDNAPRDSYMSPDGTKLFVVTDVLNKIWRYDLSTPFDLSTAVYSGISGSSYTGTAYSIQLKPDGTEVYVSDSGASRVYQTTLVTPWDLSVVQGPVWTTVEGTSCRSMRIKKNGTKLYTSSQGTDRAYEYDLTVPWDITSAVYTGNSLDLLSTSGINTGNIEISNDGTTLFHNYYGQIKRFKMSTPWDLSTAVYQGSRSLPGTVSGGNQAFGLSFTPGDEYLFVTNSGTRIVYRGDVNTIDIDPTLIFDNPVSMPGGVDGGLIESATSVKTIETPTYSIDFNDGAVQEFEFGAHCAFDFINFPTDGTSTGKVLLIFSPTIEASLFRGTFVTGNGINNLRRNAGYDYDGADSFFFDPWPFGLNEFWPGSLATGRKLLIEVRSAGDTMYLTNLGYYEE